MNLWVKRTGQLLAAVLLLMSCEDESFLLGFRNQNKKINIKYHEIKFSGDQTSVLLIDSILTDHDHNDLNATTRFLIGQYFDNSFGTVRSEVYTEFQPSFYNAIDGTGMTFDSVTLQLQLDYYDYGFEGDSEEKFTIHRITEDTLSYFKRYYYNSSFGYDPNPLGEATLNLDYTDYKVSETISDTILIKTRLDTELGDEFGAELFAYAASYDSALLHNTKFRYQFKGLVFAPAQNNYILGFDPASNLNRITLHYHNSAAEQFERSFYFSPFSPSVANSFNKISTSRSGDLASLSQPYESYAPPSGLRYVQSGSPVITKLDLSQYYNFIRGEGAYDSLEQIVINSAVLSIGIETPPTGYSPPSKLILRVLKKTSETKFEFTNSFIDSDSTQMSGFFVTADGKYYIARGDASSTSAVEMTYDSDHQRYVGHLSLFLQNLFDKKNGDVDLLYLGLFPAAPPIGKTVDRVVFKQENIKLGVYYTTPIIPNLE
jgi:hypothetical protein